MAGPVLLVVEENADALHTIEQELQDRYARHYEVTCTPSVPAARSQLEDLAATGREVALILAAESFATTTGSELLDSVRHVHPHARRGLLIDWGTFGDRGTGETLFDAMAHGRIDHYVVRPSAPPDEVFHSAISTLLLEWAESRRVFPFAIHVVGESWSGRAHELREVLGRCAMPHTFSLSSSAVGRALLAAAGTDVRLPIIVLPNGTVLQNPSNVEIAVATGSPITPGHTDFDLVIVGSGPAGLSAAVYGASEGFRTLVVDEGGIGGQATSSSLIRNYLGFPRGVSGRQLAQRAYEQAWVFGADFAVMQRVADLRREADGLSVVLSDFGRVQASALLLATGASYRRLVPARPRGAQWCRCLLRRAELGGAGDDRPGRVRARRRELRRPGGALPRPVRPPGDAGGPRRIARGGHVAVPDPRDRRDPERHRPRRGPRSWTAAGTVGWSTSPSGTGRRAGRSGSRPGGSS